MYKFMVILDGQLNSGRLLGQLNRDVTYPEVILREKGPKKAIVSQRSRD